MPPRAIPPALLAASLAGCASGTTALWRAGVARPEADAPLPRPSPAEGIEVFFKEDFGLFEETESERSFMCGATTVLREAFLVPGPAPPDRDWEVVGDVTTEELPRDEARSKITGTAISSVLGIGGREQLELGRRDQHVVALGEQAVAGDRARHLLREGASQPGGGRARRLRGARL